MYRLFFLLMCCFLHSAVVDHLKPILNKSTVSSIRNVEFIYLINLDERPEKFQSTIDQLMPFGIIPYRFSAVNGWKLSLNVINDLGTAYMPQMGSGIWGICYLLNNQGDPTNEVMCLSGRSYFAHQMSRGAIGIVLSHLSILKDAYDSGYETIWVLEDDIEVIRDPRVISDRIDELDQLVGANGWDILFTDCDTKGQDGQYVSSSSHAWYLDYNPPDPLKFSRWFLVRNHFLSTGARYGTYSMIVRCSGMKKILDFFEKRNLFLPLDMEFTLPELIQLYSVVEDIVSTFPNAPSDNVALNL